MLLDSKKFDRTNEGTCYVAEAAELGLRAGVPVPKTFVLHNCPKPGQHRSFKMTGVDKAGGDIYGWRFVEEDGPNKGRDFTNPGNPTICPPLTALIIND